MNREDWLTKCMKRLRPKFEALGFPLPEKIRASCSWPSKSALANKNRRIGEAWSAKCSGDSTFEIFISPSLKNPVEVAAVLVHELVHCAVGLECGHRGAFRRAAKVIGLEGKMTATKAGEELIFLLEGIIAKIGDYPHAELKFSNAPKTQSTRMRKVECEECGCIVRMTRRWIDEIGAPTCACGGTMIEEEADE